LLTSQLKSDCPAATSYIIITECENWRSSYRRIEHTWGILFKSRYTNVRIIIIIIIIIIIESRRVSQPRHCSRSMHEACAQDKSPVMQCSYITVRRNSCKQLAVIDTVVLSWRDQRQIVKQETVSLM